MGVAFSGCRQPRRVLMTSDAVGGVWTYAVELARGLAAHGTEMTVAVLGPEPNLHQRRELEWVSGCAVHAHGGALEWMDDPWTCVDEAGAWLQDLARECQPDIVHLNDFSSALLPWTCPVVLASHSCVQTWWRSVKHEAAPARYAEYIRRVRAALWSADVVVTPTAAFRKQLETEYGVPLQAEVIPNGRSAEAFRPRDKEPVIFSAGRLWDDGKNLGLLDRVAPQVHWSIAFAGEAHRPNVRAFAAANVRVLGKLAPAGLIEHLGRAGIYAAPARYEPFGLSVLEAALSGCALVLSDIPSFRELWEECALFVPCDDEAAWIDALNDLAASHAERKWLQSRARARAMTLPPSRQALSYYTLYQTLLAGRSQLSAALSA